MGRLLDALLGDAREQVQRDAERVMREARAAWPRPYNMASETRHGIKVEYTTDRSHQVPFLLNPEVVMDRRDTDGGWDLANAIIDQVDDHRCSKHGEPEPVVIPTGETVAWVCPRCDWHVYAEGW